MKRLKPLILLFFFMTVVPSLAQIDCPPFVAQVLESLAQICSPTERNEACYGNRLVLAQPSETIEFLDFDEIGERESISNIRAISMSALDDVRNEWGITYMRLQTTLPDTIPGENVTFILIGDVEMVNATETGAANPNAFYLRTGIGEPICQGAPPDGLMVQTPQGRGQIRFSINGVDVALGSTAFFTAQAGQNMTISTLEGTSALRTDRSQPFLPLVAGTAASIPLNNNYLPDGSPTTQDIQPMSEQIRMLPVEILDHEIPPVEPLNLDQVTLVQSFINNGLPPCGSAPFLPPCADFPVVVGGELCEIGEDGVTPECEADPDSIWEAEGLIEVVDQNDCMVINCEPVEEVLPTAAPAVIPTLPAGCVPGQCLQDPAIACTCVLCGVACPDGQAVEPVSTAQPNTSDAGNGQVPPGDNNTGNDGGTVVDPPIRATSTPMVVPPTSVPPTDCAVPGPGGSCDLTGPPGS